MRHLTVLLTAFFLLVPSVSAWALDVTGQSRTYLQSFQIQDSARLLPLYEYLDLRTEHANDGAISFNFGGWYRYDLQNEKVDERHNDDLQYAYVGFQSDKANSTLKLGRIRVHEGAASALVDGAYGRTDLLAGFGVAAYGGSPVETTYDIRQGNSIYGGRIFHSVPSLYTLGVSYLDEKDHSGDFRREESVDIWLKPASMLQLQGMSSYNSLSRNWMLHNYSVTAGPFGSLRFIGEFSRVSYKDYFAGVTTGVFAFPSIDPDETVTSSGGSVSYDISHAFSAAVDYKNYSYRIAGHANYYGGKLAYAGESFGAGAGIHRMDGATASLRYDEESVYVMQKVAAFDFSLQEILVTYKEEINGVKNSYTGSAAAGYALNAKARLVADVQYARTPDFNREVRGMLSFVYHFDASSEPRKKSQS